MIVVFGVNQEDAYTPQNMTLTAPSGYTLAAFSINIIIVSCNEDYKEHTSTNSENPGAFSVNNGGIESIAYTFALGES